MRKIDGKFRVDGDQIIKTTNGEVLPRDEPLFLLRARDRLALIALYAFQEASQVDHCTDFHLEGVRSAINSFETFRRRYPEKMKQHGINEGR